MRSQYRSIRIAVQGFCLSGIGILLASTAVFAIGKIPAPNPPSPAPIQTRTSCPAGQTLQGGACFTVFDTNTTPSVQVVPGGVSCPAGEHAVSPGTNQQANYNAYFGIDQCVPNAVHHKHHHKAVAKPKPISSAPAPTSTPPTPALPAAYTTTSVIVGWTFNGCEPYPALTTIEDAEKMHAIDNEPIGLGITWPHEYALMLPLTAPAYKVGEPVTELPEYNNLLWANMVGQQAIDQILAGPGWGVESEETQKYLHTPHTVSTKTGTTIVWTITPDGPPQWTAREVYALNSCPFPIVNVTTEPSN